MPYQVQRSTFEFFKYYYNFFLPLTVAVIIVMRGGNVFFIIIFRLHVQLPTSRHIHTHTQYVCKYYDFSTLHDSTIVTCAIKPNRVSTVVVHRNAV